MTPATLPEPAYTTALLCHRSFRLLLLSGVALVTAYAVTPEPLTQADKLNRAEHDKQVMFSEGAPVNGPISLEEAMARAIKFNLDHRAELLNQVVSQAQLDLTTYDMLPKWTSAAGLNGRNTYSASSSVNVVTGEQSLVPSYSQERGLGQRPEPADLEHPRFRGQRHPRPPSGRPDADCR